VAPRFVNAAGAARIIQINFMAISGQYAELVIMPILLNRGKIKDYGQSKKLAVSAASAVSINIIVP
jgi:hypothetical protein